MNKLNVVKTIFIPCRAQADVGLVVENILEKVPFDKIGLVSTAQFVHQLDEIGEKLEKRGKKVVISPGHPNPGQVLGCDARAAKGADCYVYLGTGHFHPLRVAEETGKSVYMAHPSGGIEAVSKDQLMKRAKIRAARMHRFKEAKTVGIIVSTKPGQMRMEVARELKKKLEGEKQTFIFTANEIKPDCFMGYDVDVWVNTACPRIAEDCFERPMVDVSEIKGLKNG